jgi:threonine dehydrogenase-like Zn-dependent dehydrogenase
MRAVFLPGGREAVVREIEVPRPGDGEVLLAMKAAGLCGSDLHMHYRIAPESRHGVVFGLKTDPGVVPGHEPAGVVAEVGKGVWQLKPGDRVAVHHMAGCGVCVECRRGWDINCQRKWGTYGLDRPGGMQDFMVVRARDCVLVPDNVGLAEAAYYTCGAGTGYLALKRAGFGLGDTVAVVGLGPVGVAGAYFAASAGARVIGIDTLDERRRFAESNGIGYTTNPNSEDAAEAVRQATGGKGADVVLETSGSAAGRLLALDIAAIRGRVVCIGFADTATTIDLQATIIQKQLDVRGAWMFPITSLQELLDDVGLRGTSIANLIPHSFPITDAAAAWRTFDEGSLGKTIIAWAD